MEVHFDTLLHLILTVIVICQFHFRKPIVLTQCTPDCPYRKLYNTLFKALLGIIWKIKFVKVEVPADLSGENESMTDVDEASICSTSTIRSGRRGNGTTITAAVPSDMGNVEVKAKVKKPSLLKRSVNRFKRIGEFFMGTKSKPEKSLCTTDTVSSTLVNNNDKDSATDEVFTTPPGSCHEAPENEVFKTPVESLQEDAEKVTPPPSIPVTPAIIKDAVSTEMIKLEGLSHNKQCLGFMGGSKDYSHVTSLLFALFYSTHIYDGLISEPKTVTTQQLRITLAAILSRLRQGQMISSSTVALFIRELNKLLVDDEELKGDPASFYSILSRQLDIPLLRYRECPTEGDSPTVNRLTTVARVNMFLEDSVMVDLEEALHSQYLSQPLMKSITAGGPTHRTIPILLDRTNKNDQEDHRPIHIPTTLNYTLVHTVIGPQRKPLHLKSAICCMIDDDKKHYVGLVKTFYGNNTWYRLDDLKDRAVVTLSQDDAMKLMSEHGHMLFYELDPAVDRGLDCEDPGSSSSSIGSCE